MKKLRLLGTVCVCLIVLASFNVNAATVQLSGTGWPAPGGTTYFGDGNLVGSPGGRTFTITPDDVSQYDTLFYVLGDYPGGIWNPAGPRIGQSGNTLDTLTYNASDSNFGSGIVRWTGTTTIGVYNGSIYVPTVINARFTLTVTDTVGNSQSLTDASTISGMPASVGAAYQVPGSFKANWLYELNTGGGWNAANNVYGSLATDSNKQLLTSSGGAFYYTAVVPVPTTVWLFSTGLLGLVGIARRKKSV